MEGKLSYPIFDLFQNNGIWFISCYIRNISEAIVIYQTLFGGFIIIDIICSGAGTTLSFETWIFGVIRDEFPLIRPIFATFDFESLILGFAFRGPFQNHLTLDCGGMEKGKLNRQAGVNQTAGGDLCVVRDDGSHTPVSVC